MASGQWDFWIDRGGTFTDVVARDPTGRLHVRKLLSENPDAYADAATEELPGKVQLDVNPGDVLIIETPGGDGYGAPLD